MVFMNLIFSLIMMVISYAIQMILMPRPENNDAVVGDMDIPTAEDGKTIPVVFGTILLKDSNIIDYFDAQAEAIKSDGGKK